MSFYTSQPQDSLTHLIWKLSLCLILKSWKLVVILRNSVSLFEFRHVVFAWWVRSKAVIFGLVFDSTCYWVTAAVWQSNSVLFWVSHHMDTVVMPIYPSHSSLLFLSRENMVNMHAIFFSQTDMDMRSFGDLLPFMHVRTFLLMHTFWAAYVWSAQIW